ncbi:hypothetical protein [Idiomarina zobellii]|uniref:Uncharacterized protein n=1 Tax=Idiomarina zobellii TaxID=86103 RepID=A0A837NET4_9GAMM|nr:hypothetical protein [Idiomarina zobellii]KPD23686.1 hypothetical protein AFK76_07435 [Idiomarina zobellii]SDF87409.1 hypothetical protein SAMN04515658_10613 [Idiomarina zobellii]
MKRLIFIVLAIFLTCSFALSAQAEKLKQVSFSEVLELSSGSSVKKHSYGTHPSQFFEYWPAKNDAGHFDMIHPKTDTWTIIIQQLNKELKP